MNLNRRDWLQKSLLTSSAFLLPKIDMDIWEEDDLVRDVLRLHWNENPFGPSDKVVEAVKQVIGDTNLYWDEKNDALRSKLGGIHNLNEGHYLLTSGSTEILSLLGQHVGLQKGEILMGSNSFPTIDIFGRRCGASINYSVMTSDDRIDLDNMMSAISNKTKLIFICNPNNPTSTELDNSALRAFCKSVPENILICVDEAYIEFSKGGINSSLVDLVEKLPNLIICRTFSKVYGLAGFRLGYAISQSQNIQAMQNRYPALGMAPGLLPIVAGITALDDQIFVDHVVAETNKSKALLYTAFDDWGVSYAHSSTNFIYAHDDKFADDLLPKLKSKDILITKWPSMKDHIRISMGKPDWIHTLVSELSDMRV